MCGIVGAVAQHDVVPTLLDGLKRLEYRGYDSAGIAVFSENNELRRVRTVKKVNHLKQLCQSPTNITEAVTSSPLKGHIGIAHTRWATHGSASEENAHPHSVNQNLALVHNGILENYQELKKYGLEKGYQFTSQTDTEVILQLLNEQIQQGLDTKQALKNITKKMQGSFALGIVNLKEPNQATAFRHGSPLVIGIGIEEYYFASDVLALLPVTQQYIVLEEGDIAAMSVNSLVIENSKSKVVFDSLQDSKKNIRRIKISHLQAQTNEKGQYQHFMLKEIFEQPVACTNTLQGRISEKSVLVESFGHSAVDTFSSIQRIQIIACGTSYHAGMIFKYWCEDIIQIPVNIEVASEFRYRNPVIQNNTLMVAISQSGETADTIAALKVLTKNKQQYKDTNNPILAICNNSESSLVQLADLKFITCAGPEIGVASTKAFITQLVALALLLVALGKIHKRMDKDTEKRIIHGVKQLPILIQQVLNQEKIIAQLAADICNANNIIFLGRGSMFPVALEGALKLKEISYIHAEAFAAGELKHGPLALIEKNTPVVVVAPKDDLLAKLKSNLEEVSARGGKLYVFADQNSDIQDTKHIKTIKVGKDVGRIRAPILFSIPLQLLAYHVALALGKNIDQPRNLAKSVTVE